MLNLKVVETGDLVLMITYLWSLRGLVVAGGTRRSDAGRLSPFYFDQEEEVVVVVVEEEEEEVEEEVEVAEEGGAATLWCPQVTQAMMGF